MGWTWKGLFEISPNTTIYEVGVAEGRAYIQAGAFATRYDWYVIDLAGIENHREGWVLIVRGGGISSSYKSSSPFLKNMESDITKIDYIAEKFPGLAEKETKELALVTFRFLTDIFDVNPKTFGFGKKDWRPE